MIFPVLASWIKFTEILEYNWLVVDYCFSPYSHHVKEQKDQMIMFSNT